jgi:hypothetical protein
MPMTQRLHMNDALFPTLDLTYSRGQDLIVFLILLIGNKLEYYTSYSLTIEA